MTPRSTPANAGHGRARLLQLGFANPLVRVLVACAFVATVAVLVVPGDGSSAVHLDASWIDRVAADSITATHDFTYVRDNPDRIRQVRGAAAAGVLPVWDHDVSVGEQIEADVHSVFDQARQALFEEGSARHRATLVPDGSGEASDGAEEDDTGGEGSPSGQDADLAAEGAPAPEPPTDAEMIALVPADERLEIVADLPHVARLASAATGQGGDLHLPELAADGFSVPAEDALVNLLGAATEQKIVADVRRLEDVGPAGITMRTVRGTQTVDERVVTQFVRPFSDLSDRARLIDSAQHHLGYIEDRQLAAAIQDAAKSLITVNTVFNAAETQIRQRTAMDTAAANFRESQTQQVREGELLVARGQVISRDDWQVLTVMRESAPPESTRVQTFLGAAGLAVLLIFPILVFALGNLRRFSREAKDLTMMACVLISHLAITRVGIFLSDQVVDQVKTPVDALYVLVPFAMGAMLVRILTNAENALVYGLVYAILAGVLFDFDVAYVAYALVASIVANAAVGSAQTRTDIMRAGGIVGGVMVGTALGLALVGGDPVSAEMLEIALCAGLSGVVSALFVYGVLPVFEVVFRYTTDMRLMELANLNHPALKELILKAPGSYHHSMMVGQLVEAACEVVGANALLGRVGSYFHDIGKMKTPQYFAENQAGVNPHDKLKPNMSALVIKAHVKDGVELARQYKLPKEIVDFIKEHHGTSLIAFFYRRALEQQEDVNEADYRYAGPKPRSRETAICMIADGLEAASRSLPDPSHAHLKGLVQKMINKAFIDGQLDDCDLTLKDLNVIAQAFLLRLTAFYHHRPEYPDARKSQPPRGQRKTDTSREAEDGEADDDRDDDPGTPPTDGDLEPPETREESGLHLRRLGM